MPELIGSPQLTVDSCRSTPSNFYGAQNRSGATESKKDDEEYEYNDAFLRPYNVSNCIYDLMLGSQNTNTLFKHELNYRTYFYVSQGSIKIKLTPPTSKKYLNCNYDYENFEFSSPINPWNVKSKHQLNFNKIKCFIFIYNNISMSYILSMKVVSPCIEMVIIY